MSRVSLQLYVIQLLHPAPPSNGRHLVRFWQVGGEQLGVNLGFGCNRGGMVSPESSELVPTCLLVNQEQRAHCETCHNLLLCLY